jgi:homoserine/homoserine lactone efflux protein
MAVDPANLGAFVAAALIVVVSPGPDTILILRHAIAGGRRIGLATVAGVQIGLVGHTLLAVVGLSLVIASAPVVFSIIAVAGAAYIAWLGYDSIRSGVIRIEATAKAGLTPLRGLRDAAVTNLLNPKVILLFLALMPNFTDVERGNVPLQLATLGVVLIGINTLWQVPLALAADAIGRLVARPALQRVLNVGTGAILIGFAVFLLVDHVPR